MRIKSSLAHTSLACVYTYSHELGAGPHELSEAQQEVLLCGQNLSQLEREWDFMLNHLQDLMILKNKNVVWFVWRAVILSHLWQLNPSIRVLVDVGHELLHLFFESSLWRILVPTGNNRSNTRAAFKWIYMTACATHTANTHHARSSSRNLQLLKEALQFLPLNVAISCEAPEEH